MKFHKSLITLAVAASTLSPLVMAAPTEQPEPSAPHEARMAHGNPLKDAVVASWNLDDDELTRLTQADNDFRTGLRKLHGDEEMAPREQRRAAMQPLLEQRREQLADVLTEEQLHAYRMLERPRPMMRHHGGPEREPAQVAARLEQRYAPLFATWNLDQDQSAGVLNAERTFFDGLHQMKRPDLKGDDDSRDARGARFKQLLEQRHSALASVLDDEQVTAFEALTKPRGPHAGPRGGSRQGDEAPAAG